MIAIIGGSGMSRFANMQIARRQVLRTPFGEPSSAAVFGTIAGKEVVFIARHGHGHTIPPHRVNYRANIWGLRDLGVETILSVASVGGIAQDLSPGTLAVPDQIIDYTWGRSNTFFDSVDQPVHHIDFTHPYTESLRSAILAAATQIGVPMVDHGTYAATSGPRLETAAEINRLERDGATMVGMTGMPEACLARELGLNYAAIAVVANWAAGRGTSQHGIELDLLESILQPAMQRVHQVIAALVATHG